jgi:esterase/lipase
VLLAPFMAIRHSHRLPFEMASVLRPIARFVPNVPRWGSPFRDRSARRALAKADRFHTFSIHATLSALELIEIVKPKLATITIPTLIIQGKLDAVIEPRAVSWLHEQLGSIDKTLVILPRSDHLIALDRERDQVLELTTNFLLRSEKMVGSTGDR